MAKAVAEDLFISNKGLWDFNLECAVISLINDDFSNFSNYVDLFLEKKRNLKPDSSLFL